MSIRKTALLVVIVALALPALASAATFLRADPSGLALPSGSTIKNTANDRATWLTTLETFDCTATTFSAAVGHSGTASVTGTLTSLTLDSCDSSSILFRYACSLANAGIPTVHVTASAGGGTVQINNTFLRCAFVGSPAVACYFTLATIAGSYQNAGSSLSFSNLLVSHAAHGRTDDAGGACPPTSALNLRFTDVVSVQNGRATTVTVTTS